METAKSETAEPAPAKKKSPSGLIGFLIFLIILIGLGYLGYLGYLLIQYKPQIVTETVELQNTGELQKIQATTRFTNPVSTSESTGRTDPLAPF